MFCSRLQCTCKYTYICKWVTSGTHKNVYRHTYKHLHAVTKMVTQYTNRRGHRRNIKLHQLWQTANGFKNSYKVSTLTKAFHKTHMQALTHMQTLSPSTHTRERGVGTCGYGKINIRFQKIFFQKASLCQMSGPKTEKKCGPHVHSLI